LNDLGLNELGGCPPYWRFLPDVGIFNDQDREGHEFTRAINGKEMNSALAPESAAQSLDFLVERPWLTANEMLAFYIERVLAALYQPI
jgi:hypothetical protein